RGEQGAAGAGARVDPHLGFAFRRLLGDVEVAGDRPGGRGQVHFGRAVALQGDLHVAAAGDQLQLSAAGFGDGEAAAAGADEQVAVHAAQPHVAAAGDHCGGAGEVGDFDV